MEENSVAMVGCCFNYYWLSEFPLAVWIAYCYALGFLDVSVLDGGEESV
jgi:hypothetical protein